MIFLQERVRNVDAALARLLGPRVVRPGGMLTSMQVIGWWLELRDEHGVCIDSFLATLPVAGVSGDGFSADESALYLAGFFLGRVMAKRAALKALAETLAEAHPARARAAVGK